MARLALGAGEAEAEKKQDKGERLFGTPVLQIHQGTQVDQVL